ncbi:transporter substrate-binding domain-containing protein [Vicingaceae bacterium]|nr:transporter substrate-binding domain-containing protein [Vicingaceae bacterium]
MLIIKRLFYFILLLTLIACNNENDSAQKNTQQIVFDLAEIKEDGELRALVDYSTTSYFLYRGRPMGFEYELLSKFCKNQELELKIIPITDLSSVMGSLNSYAGDLIAANLTKTKRRLEHAAFTRPLIRTKQVLVQRNDKNEECFISQLDQLEGKEVFVPKGSSFYERLVSLSDEIGGEIYAKETAKNVTVEELIAKVASAEIDYTIADEHVAKINKAYFRNIHIKNAVSLEQQLGWALRKSSPQLLAAINLWLEKFKKTTTYRVIYLKYYGNTTLYKSRINSDFFTSKSGTISPYDKVIKQYASSIHWDWRLLTSLIYQESGFDPNSSSWAGAQGLMQLMPETASEYGLDSTENPRDNIETGVEYLKWLDEQFKEKVPDSAERIKFVLASYNVGLGHIFDAMRLAQKYDLDPQVWKGNVAEMILKKSNPQYYRDDVVYYGYCRGSETYKYVNEIYSRFEHYRNVTQ